MELLARAFPDPVVLLQLEPEELGGKILFLLRQGYSDGMIHRDHLTNNYTGGAYSSHEIRIEVSDAINEAWSWLIAQGLIIPVSGINGNNGYMRLSRRAQRFESEQEFIDYSVARILPRDALHERIRAPVWGAFMRGEFDVAVFQAMKAVEVSVREACGLPSNEVGVNLMRKAFNPENGKLTDKSAEGGERDALSALFAGAMGVFKNPQSHRDVDLSNPTEAMEAIMFANYLLRLVDARNNILRSSRAN